MAIQEETIAGIKNIKPSDISSGAPTIMRIINRLSMIANAVRNSHNPCLTNGMSLLKFKKLRKNHPSNKAGILIIMDTTANMATSSHVI